jgi:hypothetical protein
MHDLLRNRLGYDGLLLTDSFEMSAIPNGGIDTVKKAVEAGADLVLGPQIPVLALSPKSIGQPVREVAADRLDGEQFDTAAASFSLDVARRGVGWVGSKARFRLEPNDPGPTVFLITDEVGESRPLETFLHRVRSRAPTCCIKQGTCFDRDDVAGRKAVLVVVSKWEHRTPAETIRTFAFRVAETATKTALVLFGAVDTACLASGILPTLFCGDATVHSQTVASEVLFGDFEATGRPDLPFSTRERVR